MLILMLFLLFGAGFAYIAQHNLMLVSLSLGQYVISDIPLFYVIIGSAIAGLGIGYIIYLIHEVSTAFTMHGKDKTLKATKNEVADLTKRVHQLELENERLKHHDEPRPSDPNSL